MTEAKRRQRDTESRKLTIAVSFPLRRRKAQIKLQGGVRNEDVT